MGRPRKYFVRKGQVLGKLKVIDPGARTARGVFAALVQCRCGSPPKLVTLRNLVTGATVTCGCLQREAAAEAVRLPQVRQAVRRYLESPGNAARLAAMNRSPEARSRPRAPETLENLARWQRSPECSAHMVRLNQSYAGSDREPIDVPDPDWCDRHGISFYDHAASQQRLRCYRAWTCPES